MRFFVRNKEIEKVLEIITDAGLKPSFNLRRELVELIDDIASRDNLKPVQALLSSGVSEIINEPKLSGPDKLKKIKELLLRKRYPAYSKAKDTFKQQLKDLKLSPKLKITHSPFFETNDLKIEFGYKQLNELEDIVQSLEKLSKVDLVKNALEAAEDNC
jgi:ParB family chromosome partitioning protein